MQGSGAERRKHSARGHDSRVRAFEVIRGERGMDVTKVSLRPVAMNKVCAIASVVIDDAFVVHDLRVVNGEKGLFVAMPSRKLPNGEFRDICHPINAEARQQIQESVLAQFELDGGLEHFSSAAVLAAADPAPALE
jgi:stage V sporulation protein G